jgi:outer membrane protein OmpA-like peptidoglycan-associated protein
MLRRVALSILLLIVLGVAGIFAAGHLGINLPWEIATKESDAPSDDRAGTPKSETSKPTDTAEKAIEDTTAALTPPSPKGQQQYGSVAIDISRISPNGVSVFAGKAAPDSYVTVMENGKPAGTVKTDSEGEWMLSTEHKFASADPKISYEVSTTPPPAPEPPAAKVAKADPAPTSAAGEVMRKFENMVEEARKEAKKEAAPASESTAAETPSSTPAPSAAATETNRAATPDANTASPPAERATPATTPAQDTTPASPPPTVTAEAAPTVTVQEPKPASEGVKTDAIPVPLMFVYNESKLTSDGERAAALLLEYLTLKRLNAVELTGHADERGTDNYNYDLSRERLETVARILKDGGYAGELKLSPKGKSEPYMGVDRSAYSGEALFQLDRRVELRVTR